MRKNVRRTISNAASGIDYAKLNSWKAIMQAVALKTVCFPNFWGFNFSVLRETIGKSAVIFRLGNSCFVLVIEGLGTKIEVALAMQRLSGQLYFGQIARDNVAMAINDAAVCGAKPLVYVDYTAVGDSEWFCDLARARNLAQGFLEACKEAHVTLLGGESPALPPIISPHTIDLAGAVLGVIEDKSRLIRGNVKEGDQIIFLPSNGVCSNGLSPLRMLADSDPNIYLAPIGDGRTFGQAILEPTPIIVDTVQRILGVARPHAIEPLTGGAFLKIARCPEPFTYLINCVPKLTPFYRFIREKSGVDDKTAYTTWNMGALAAIIAPSLQTPKILRAVKGAFLAGQVENGPRQVVLRQFNNLVLKDDNW